MAEGKSLWHTPQISLKVEELITVSAWLFGYAVRSKNLIGYTTRTSARDTAIYVANFIE
jgi:hypothetical protein